MVCFYKIMMSFALQQSKRLFWFTELSVIHPLKGTKNIFTTHDVIKGITILYLMVLSFCLWLKKSFWFYYFSKIFTRQRAFIRKWFTWYCIPFLLYWKPMHWDGMWVVILENNNIDSDIISNFLTLFLFLYI